MRTKLLLFSISILSCITSFGQLENSPFIFENYNGQLDSFNGLILNGHFEIGSSSINAGMMSDYLFSDRFSDKNKEKFRQSNTTNTRLKSLTMTELKYVNNTKNSGWELSLDFKNALYLKSSKPFSQMLLFGNKEFANQSVSSSKSHALDINYSNLMFSKAALQTEKWNIRWSAGLTAIYGYADISATEISVFTEENGEYLDIAIQSASFSQKNAGLDGLGINLGIDIRRKISSSQQLSFQIKQLSPSFLFNKNSYLIDSSFRFEGLEVETDYLSDGNFNSWLDSIKNETFFNNSERKKLVLLPIDIQLAYIRELKNSDIFQLSIATTDFGRNSLSAAVNYSHELSNSIMWRTALSYGIFTQLVLSQHFELIIAKQWHTHISLYGINALLAPRNFGFYGVSVGLAKEL